MKEIRLHGRNGASQIVVGQSLERLADYVSADKKIVVLDGRIAAAVEHRLPAWEVEIMSGGEEAKTLARVEELYQRFLSLALDRTSYVIALGGGTVCDAAAFAAATYLRGLPFGLIPSTLLAQVDASIGGKNGVNFGGYKNLVGTIVQPEFVLCDPSLLKTLPPPEVRNGYAEVIKHAVIGDLELFEFLEKNAAAALALEPEIVEEILYRSLSVKAKFVEADEMEKGRRVLLNFGHTLGHAIESTQHLSHGQAVSVGMICDLRLSVNMGLLDSRSEGRVVRLLELFGLPTKVAGDRKALIDAVSKDKKRKLSNIRVGLLRGIGAADLFELPLDRFEDAVGDLL